MLLRFLRFALVDIWQRFRAQDRLRGRLQAAAEVRVFGLDRLDAAPDVYVDVGAYLHCGGASWCPDQGHIRMGAGSYIGPHCILFGMGGLEIGNDVMVAPNVVISTVQHPYADTSMPMYHQPRVYGRIVIEDDVYIGSGAVITPNVTIGRGAVIGAGAVVTKDVPPLTVAVGVPARVVSHRTANPDLEPEPPPVLAAPNEP